MTLPPIPSCVPHEGVIQCPCAAETRALACNADRVFWLHAHFLAGMASNELRKQTLATVPAARREQLRAAAWQLMQERAAA